MTFWTYVLFSIGFLFLLGASFAISKNVMKYARSTETKPAITSAYPNRSEPTGPNTNLNRNDQAKRTVSPNSTVVGSHWRVPY